MITTRFCLLYFLSLVTPSTSMSTFSTVAATKRGAFILFEGIDRCGKSSQAAMLSKYLTDSSACKSNELIRFPDRTSTIGQQINSYLQSTSDLNDQAIHLLFSANRWESSDGIKAKLEAGCTLICDRYAYSGVAFSSAKGMNANWCRTCDQGLPAPDCIIYLDLSVEEAAKRGNYGEERYEKEEFQKVVRQQFSFLQEADGKKCQSDLTSTPVWHVLDAGRSIEDIHQEIIKIAESAVAGVKSKPIGKLWM